MPSLTNRLDLNNNLLGSLSHEPLSALRSHLRRITLRRGGVLCEASNSMRFVYFIESGLAALVTGHRAPVVLATVGREGAVGGSTPLLGGGIAFGCYQMLISGSVLAVEESRFHIALRESSNLHKDCVAYTQAFFVQVLNNLTCKRLHSPEQRCARWLLMVDDQTEDDTLELPEDDLSSILCVPQSEAHAVASRLRQAGLIRLRDGLITILDRRKLEAAACACYFRWYEHYERFLSRPWT